MTFTIQDLPKTHVFTSSLPPDPEFPTPKASHEAERATLGPRLVKDAFFTFVRPEPPTDPELLAVSDAALDSLAIEPESTDSQEFLDIVSGRRFIDEDKVGQEDAIYPWAQCYGGYQFGSWAGQLGDGRAISLFETTNASTKTRYEVQLKGAGRTPYSRFADGKAVLRSSIREFVVSEYLNAIGIPTTRALSLTLCPKSRVRRETMEPGAIVARFAQSWIRFGTFDLTRSRGDRKLIRTLADYIATNVFRGWESLPAKRADDAASNELSSVDGKVPLDTCQGVGKLAENRYVRLYREVVRRNAKTVAAWQAYGFMNGVLNTDNTSIMGLSMDFGPFAFLDNFDPTYTPNHDDHMSRYSYRNQPNVIWWNLIRLGEALGELIGSGSLVDDSTFVNEGMTEDQMPEIIERAETIIARVGDEYKAVFAAEYSRLMTARFGLKTYKKSDSETIFAALLSILEEFELDFHHAFRRLCEIDLANIDTRDGRVLAAGAFFHKESASSKSGLEHDAAERLASWLEDWSQRITEDWGIANDQQRQEAMRRVNPKFVPRSWVLDELITRVEKKGEREVLKHIMQMTLQPFNEQWSGDRAEEERFCGDVPRFSRAMQCSCSS